MQDEGRYDAANKLNMYLRKFITFLGKNEIPFKDFDSLLIRNYNTWLENQKLGRNSISLYIRNLKRVYQLAVADGVTNEQHPFEGVDVSYRVKKEKNKLTPKEVIQLRYMDVSNLHPSAIFARDLFLFAVFTNGMTGSDLFYLTKDNIKGDHLTYTSKATGKEETVIWNPYLAIHNINRNLKKVGQMIDLSFPLTLTVAHHTWKSMTKGLNVVDLL